MKSRLLALLLLCTPLLAQDSSSITTQAGRSVTIYWDYKDSQGTDIGLPTGAIFTIEEKVNGLWAQAYTCSYPAYTITPTPGIHTYRIAVRFADVTTSTYTNEVEVTISAPSPTNARVK